MSKKLLSMDEIERQMALELPERETMALINLFIVNVGNNLTINANLQLCVACDGVDFGDVTFGGTG